MSSVEHGEPRDEAGRVELSDASKALALRDYFLRLGAVARVGDDHSVEVRFAEAALARDEPDLKGYLDSWSSINGTRAELTSEPRMVVYPRSAASTGQPPPRLGELLVQKGFITEQALSQALVESREIGQQLGRTLIAKGYVFESDLARSLAEQWSLPYVNLAMLGVDPAAVRLLPRDVGLRYLAIPVRYVGSEIQVAFVDPSDDEAIAAVQAHISAPTLAVADLSDIEMAWRQQEA